MLDESCLAVHDSLKGSQGKKSFNGLKRFRSGRTESIAKAWTIVNIVTRRQIPNFQVDCSLRHERCWTKVGTKKDMPMVNNIFPYTAGHLWRQIREGISNVSERERNVKQLAVVNGSKPFRTQGLGTFHIPAKPNNVDCTSWVMVIAGCIAHAHPCANTLLHSFWKFRLIAMANGRLPKRTSTHLPCSSLTLEPLRTSGVSKRNYWD